VEEITHCLQVSQAKVVITISTSLAVALAAAKIVGIPLNNVILLEGSAPGYQTLEELILMGKALGEELQIPPYRIPKNLKNSQVCGFLSFSSGTTGKPKAVIFSYTNQSFPGVC
jgi:4-coumarate--CoA ligase